MHHLFAEIAPHTRTYRSTERFPCLYKREVDLVWIHMVRVHGNRCYRSFRDSRSFLDLRTEWHTMEPERTRLFRGSSKYRT